ncbi:hypothetical protein POVWA2_024300 [Plasmodium ovale wallikeri]|uniref:Uncharacterized protein n=1 Tax=Plasmodium ovale wallikeri TaxID=864142 RepID=A0A1A8YTU1_PLAOA|nr:hypothetical protein POVWA1_024420 [Plasmodium ovale wallikeri]SBT35281.1 hypothetical protein POVWA2_024300 [Plasmodium ovale wallikeri]
MYALQNEQCLCVYYCDVKCVYIILQNGNNDIFTVLRMGEEVEWEEQQTIANGFFSQNCGIRNEENFSHLEVTFEETPHGSSDRDKRLP